MTRIREDQSVDARLVFVDERFEIPNLGGCEKTLPLSIRVRSDSLWWTKTEHGKINDFLDSADGSSRSCQ